MGILSVKIIQSIIHLLNYWSFVSWFQEWCWPIGYFLRAKLIFARMMDKTEPGIMAQTVKMVKKTLSKHHLAIQASPWKSLPELTNKNGEVFNSKLINEWINDESISNNLLINKLVTGTIAIQQVIIVDQSILCNCHAGHIILPSVIRLYIWIKLSITLTMTKQGHPMSYGVWFLVELLI